MRTLRDAEWWAEWLEDFFASVAGLLCREEPRRTARAYLKALLGPVERENSWQSSACTGDEAPNKVTDLLRTTVWSWEADCRIGCGSAWSSAWVIPVVRQDAGITGACQ